MNPSPPFSLSMTVAESQMEGSRCVGKLAMSSSETYRYYCLNGAGDLHLSERFEAGNDQEARVLIEQMRQDGRCEIWQSRRLVAKLSPKRLFA